MAGKLLIGTSSWSDHKNWYPPGMKSGEMLGYYATLFPIVEVNTSYYHIPARKMVEGWVSLRDGHTRSAYHPRSASSRKRTHLHTHRAIAGYLSNAS